MDGAKQTASSDRFSMHSDRAKRYVFPVIAILLTACVAPPDGAREEIGKANALESFSRQLQKLRADYRIPGLSVTVLHKQRVVLARGFGYADWNNKIPATPETPYNIASLTKPIAAVVLIKIVENGKLNLDDLMSTVLENRVFHLGSRILNGYAEGCEFINLVALDGGNPNRLLYQDYRCDTEKVTVRHHLTHTAQGKPGESYQYNGMLYGVLSHVAEESSGESFPDLVVDYVVRPTDMSWTIPSLSEAQRERVLAARANYYTGRGAGDFIPSSYPIGLSAAAGMVSTVVDLGKFDVALDQNRLVSSESKMAMFTPAISLDGRTLPYGLGWFVQNYEGLTLIWHYGWAPRAYSSLYLKVPSKQLTLVLLANSEGLSADFQLARGNVLGSPFAVAFLKSIVKVTE